MGGVLERTGKAIAHGWNAFRTTENMKVDTTNNQPVMASVSYGSARPDRTRMSFSNDRSIIAAILTRISIDVAAIPIRHVRVNEDGQFVETMKSGLNECLTVEANIDQAATMFRRDMALSLCDEGVIAVVPVDTTTDPEVSGFDIKTMRVGRITQWFPEHVRVNLWKQDEGVRKEVILSKRNVAIVENPLFPIMNEPNSTLQRLTRKLNLLDAIDEQSSSGKLDLIIQLPYVVKGETRKEQAESRRKALEYQMKDSKYGIGYIDGTEKITQLNRPAENNMMAQVEYLTKMLYAQLGLTPSVFDGTASEAEMLNYHNRTLDPILGAFTEEFKRSFLTKTARSQGQSVEYFRDPFKYIPLSAFAELADKLTRNEIATSNEMRAKIGWAPSKAANADELRNKNLPKPEEPTAAQPMELKQVPDPVIQKPTPLAIEQ